MTVLCALASLTMQVRAQPYLPPLWAVQLGFYHDRAFAEEALARVVDEHPVCQIVAVWPSSVRQYRILCGPLPNHGDALALRTELLNAWPDAFITRFPEPQAGRDQRDVSPETAPQVQPDGMPAPAAPVAAPKVTAPTAEPGEPAQPAPSLEAVERKITSDRMLALAKRQDDVDRGQFSTSLFNRTLVLGGEYTLELRYQENVGLDDVDTDDRFRPSQELQLEALYSLGHQTTLFMQATGVYEIDIRPGRDETEHTSEFKRGEMWLYQERLFDTPLDLQIGRQSFEEPREWWWEEDLDAVRLHYIQPSLRWELAVARELARESTSEDDIDPEHEDVTRVLGSLSWQWAKRHSAALFLLAQSDGSAEEPVGTIVPEDREDESDADLQWFGLRALGRFNTGDAGRLYYWFDGAGVWGDETRVEYDDAGDDQSVVVGRQDFDVQGWGADLGFTWQARGGMRPSFTLGYAVGSGDPDLDDAHDRAFRQTGLQANNGKFRGVNRFHYYGEVVRPELSNLEIATLGFGLRLLRNSSVELVYHGYRQREPAPFLRDTALREDPLGEDVDIGDALDLVFGFEEWRNLELEFILGAFRAGDAYGPAAGEESYAVLFSVEYGF